MNLILLSCVFVLVIDIYEAYFKNYFILLNHHLDQVPFKYHCDPRLLQRSWYKTLT